MNSTLLTAALCSMVIVCSSCANVGSSIDLGNIDEQSLGSNESLKPRVGEQTEIPYRINIGDIVDIKFNLTPELNDRVQVQPDGYINLRLVGSIKAEDMVPSDLTKLLEDAYTSELESPEISVNIQEMRNFKVFVGGQVSRPQVLDLLPQMTLLQAIVAAGGATNNANLRRTVLIRKTESGKSISYVLDLSNPLSANSNLLLSPLDTIFLSAGN